MILLVINNVSENHLKIMIFEIAYYFSILYVVILQLGYLVLITTNSLTLKDSLFKIVKGITFISILEIFPLIIDKV